jgi:hypothetical protein
MSGRPARGVQNEPPPRRDTRDTRDICPACPSPPRRDKRDIRDTQMSRFGVPGVPLGTSRKREKSWPLPECRDVFCSFEAGQTGQTGHMSRLSRPPGEGGHSARAPYKGARCPPRGHLVGLGRRADRKALAFGARASARWLTVPAVGVLRAVEPQVSGAGTDGQLAAELVGRSARSSTTPRAWPG